VFAFRSSRCSSISGFGSNGSSPSALSSRHARPPAHGRLLLLTHLEFNTTSIAAILTIVGYSLNEAVVVLDRIREMMRKYKRIETSELIDIAINAGAARTIMTATTVFLALLSLVLFGGTVIQSFSLAMMWGIFVGTYLRSSSARRSSSTLVFAPTAARRRNRPRTRRRQTGNREIQGRHR